MKYNFKRIEKKWQKKWEEKKIFRSVENSKRNKFYVLEMFPYPSGSGLHMGHAFNYTISDIQARFKRMQGFNVLYPVGYDSLGLPAENAAIKDGTHPRVHTEKAIKNFMKQQKSLGLSYDWGRIIMTHDSGYYKWDQWIFLKMLEKGLAYKKKSSVNWCPKCETVLANEQVHNGRCWRHTDTEVVLKELDQWFFKITDYADELYEKIDGLDKWPERIKIMQKNWIGKKEWIDIDYEIEDTDKKITVSTTRPDTNFGATFIVVAPEHEMFSGKGNLVSKKYQKEVYDYIKKAKRKTDQERLEEGRVKTGVFTGLYCINPLNEKKLPIWVADFVMTDVGTGAVVGVPGHDKRDFEFAKQFNLPVIRVVVGKDGDKSEIVNKDQVEEGEGVVINSGFLDGLDTQKAIKKIMDYLEKQGWGRRVVRFRLKDWLVSRQRYWGTPIPVVYCEKCKQNVDKNSFAINFRDEDSFNRIKNGVKTVETRALNPEEKERYFGNVKKGDYLKGVNKKNNEVIYLEVVGVKKFKNLKEAFNDKTFLGKFSKKISSVKDLEEVYNFTKDYCSRIEKNGLIAWDIKLVTPGIVAISEKNLPVKLPDKVKFGKGNPLETAESWISIKCPKCGGKARRETDTMDTFVNSSWYFLRYCDPKNKKEIFDKKKTNYWIPIDRYIGGAEHACMHLIYFRFYTKFLRDLGMLKIDEPAVELFNQGMLHGEDGYVMSKSRGNVVLPEEISSKYGIDAARLFLMSIATPDKDIEWSDNGIEGSFKFIKKVMDYFKEVKIGKSDPRTESKLNKIIKEVTNQFDSFKYNLTIIKIRELFGSLPQNTSKDILEKSLKLLHPICPHVTEELWEKIGGKGFISLSDWPKVEEKKINERFDKEEQAIEKVSVDINHVKSFIKDKKVGAAFVYVLPNELGLYSGGIEEIKKKTNLDVSVFAVNDKEKYDPEGKAKKARPGKPGIYLE